MWCCNQFHSTIKYTIKSLRAASRILNADVNTYIPSEAFGSPTCPMSSAATDQDSEPCQQNKNCTTWLQEKLVIFLFGS